MDGPPPRMARKTVSSHTMRHRSPAKASAMRWNRPESRRAEVKQVILALLPKWSLGNVVTALQALRGAGPAVAAMVVAEIGDFKRFRNPRQLMKVGLVPGERSSGITKTGSYAVRRVLFEAAWNYRHKAKVSVYMETHWPQDLPQITKDIACKAQLRLSKRYRQLLAKARSHEWRSPPSPVNCWDPFGPSAGYREAVAEAQGREGLPTRKDAENTRRLANELTRREGFFAQTA